MVTGANTWLPFKLVSFPIRAKIMNRAAVPFPASVMGFSDRRTSCTNKYIQISNQIFEKQTEPKRSTNISNNQNFLQIGETSDSYHHPSQLLLNHISRAWWKK